MARSNNADIAAVLTALAAKQDATDTHLAALTAALGKLVGAAPPAPAPVPAPTSLTVLSGPTLDAYLPPLPVCPDIKQYAALGMTPMECTAAAAAATERYNAALERNRRAVDTAAAAGVSFAPGTEQVVAERSGNAAAAFMAASRAHTAAAAAPTAQVVMAAGDVTVTFDAPKVSAVQFSRRKGGGRAKGGEYSPDPNGIGRTGIASLPYIDSRKTAVTVSTKDREGKPKTEQKTRVLDDYTTGTVGPLLAAAFDKPNANGAPFLRLAFIDANGNIVGTPSAVEFGTAVSGTLMLTIPDAEVPLTVKDATGAGHVVFGSPSGATYLMAREWVKSNTKQ